MLGFCPLRDQVAGGRRRRSRCVAQDELHVLAVANAGGSCGQLDGAARHLAAEQPPDRSDIDCEHDALLLGDYPYQQLRRAGPAAVGGAELLDHLAGELDRGAERAAIVGGPAERMAYRSGVREQAADALDDRCLQLLFR